MMQIAAPLIALFLGATADNPVFANLTERGVAADVEEGSRIKLPPPILPDGLDAAAQRRILEQAAGPRRRIEDLMRNSAVAPFVLHIDDLPLRHGAGVVRRVDLWYVAYGDLNKFSEEQFLERLVQVAPGSGASRLPTARGVLDEKQLEQRGVAPAQGGEFQERYCYSTIDLMKRVLISATRRATVTRGEESVLAAAIVDPRFTGDAQYPNQWRSIRFEPNGDFSFGAPAPYEAAGSYIKITRLHEPPQSLLVEHHQVFVEPRAWFDGSNMLRAKLPLAVQQSVREFRRQLAAPDRSGR